MIRKFFLLSALLCTLSGYAETTSPLRIFIRAGEKTHGPGQHDHPRFLAEWKMLLNERGAKADGAMNFPSPTQLENSDVLVMYAAEAGTISAEQRAHLEKFLKRGGGLVVIHDAVCGTDPQWFKTIIGGAWEHGHSKWFEGNIGLYFQDHSHPITKGVSNFDLDDEMYYDLHLMPEARILAATYAPDKRNTRDGKILPSVYDIVPQIWTYENVMGSAPASGAVSRALAGNPERAATSSVPGQTAGARFAAPGAGAVPYRAFVSIPGHIHKTFSLPQYRAFLLRGIAWAGKRDIDSLASKEELASLRYPEGGPTAPEKAAAKIVVHPDFNLNLVAAEPLIEKPISLDWDPQGRLWIAETPEYPNGRKIPSSNSLFENRPARDRISILEDSNGDGVMDKKSVFFDGLELVTSFVFHRDGVIVSQAPDIYFIRDTDHDGKADKKETLYTGFGTFDAHAVISNLRWGMDGWIYATLGYSGGDVKSGDGKKVFGKLSSGVIRFQPDGSAMEQVSSKGGNTWGLDFSPDGELFFSQANNAHINHVVMSENALAHGKIGGATSFKNIEDHNKSFPIGHYDKQAYVQIDCVGGFTAASGLAIYNGGAWPNEWNGNSFVSEPTINLVHRDIIKPSGATYVASKDRDAEFLASTDLWFRPIHQRVGPDGALYILDFYNQAVVHNDTRGPQHGANNAAVRPDRDHYFGRIWRVQHKQAKKFEIPNLAKASPQELLKALEHPNGWVRNTAARLLAESDFVLQWKDSQIKSLAAGGTPDSTLVSELWAWRQIAINWGKLKMPDPVSVFLGIDLSAALTNSSRPVAKNALQMIVDDAPRGLLGDAGGFTTNVIQNLHDSDERVQLHALLALSAIQQAATSHGRVWKKEEADFAIQNVVAVFPELKNQWLQSAAMSFASQVPLESIKAAANSKKPGAFKTLVAELSAQIGNRQDANLAAQLVLSLPDSAEPIPQIALENLAKTLRPEITPTWSPGLQKAFAALLANSADSANAALPLIVRWDKNNSLKPEVQNLSQKLLAQLHDEKQSEERRVQAATSLLGLRQMNSEILPAVAKMLRSNGSSNLKRQIIELLGTVSGAESELVEAYPILPSELRDATLNQILKRSEASLALLDSIVDGKINLGAFSPGEIHRLRTHADANVARRANEIIAKLRGPETKEKEALIAKFSPLVVQPGNAENGHKIFTANCAVCHKFQGEGKEVAPDLSGMGVHGAAELLVHVLDPNRVVEANFIAYSIETTDDESFDGIIATENKNSVVLRNASGDFEIPRSKIKSQRSTGRSLMPEGFEALGGEALRDLLTFICGAENRFRVLDLRSAFTASSARGIYNSPEATEETLDFKKFGIIKVGEIPFEIISPSKSANGNNLINLRGGVGFAKTMPQKVEIDGLNVKANRLHFLGGVGGWAFPWNSGVNKGIPVAKLSAHFADGKVEDIVMKNGEEIADYIGHYDVPGSKEIPGLLSHGQVRWFTKALRHSGVIQNLTLESFDNAVAPTFVAITAELGDAKENPAPVLEKFEWDKHPRVLIVGGGASHDFNRWFKEADSATLSANASVNYTEDISRIDSTLKDIDALYLCNNQPMTDATLRKNIFAFADAGKPLLLVHPALWYNWNDWPEYNRVLVGGGARGHEKYGEFEVNVTESGHPIMNGVPKTFRISDELYQFTPDANGTPIEVLATGKSLVTGKSYPIVWIIKHPKTKIVAITLGHDAASHEHPAYKAILQNAISWMTAGTGGAN